MGGTTGVSLTVNPPCGSSRPLHRGAGAVALRQAQVIAHADFIAVADDRACPAGSASGCRPSPDGGGRLPASARGGGGCRGRRAACPWSGPKAANTASRCVSVRRPRSSSSWLRRNMPHCAVAGRARVALHGLRQRPAVGCCQRVEQRLVDLEVEHHLQAIAGLAEILQIIVRQGYWPRPG